ncbi:MULTISPECIES: urease accessory protein UreF [Dactylosporangium]|uniref:Urease accessory protein UreF n=2 Tax=Dactylosporangium TaxID=35753 RepID=A0A9W6NKK9_9ACTN|nr:MULTISPECIES: urease accessory UreF family protein [Dactylosporangium]UAB97851.1 urease accessory protein UreF [Dactylosporangium vinaceum]UWZ46089.1 urease accessory protein UreF [Dactylosporangium matsuzakiense]GLL00221.1 urease accessory protein UreF [Dactylosporangium matsuzakiense]
MHTSLLLLADGRFPSGGHAHSGGLEAAVVRERVRDLDDLREFLRGRLRTAGLVTAAFTAAACARPEDMELLEAELAARTPSPALRLAARRQGRSLCRAALAIWPGEYVARADRLRVSQPVALGIAAHAAGLRAEEAAQIAAYHAISGPASAAVRLLGLDPYRVHALLADLGAECDEVAHEAATSARGPASDLPAASAPLLDVSAEDHASWEVRLFAS